LGGVQTDNDGNINLDKLYDYRDKTFTKNAYCEETYEGVTMGETEDGVQLRFPDTGEACFRSFPESLYPIKPWHDPEISW